MSDARAWLVGGATAAYALVLSTVTVLMLLAFATEHDLGIFAQYVWLLGHLHEPFGTITLRPMLDDHFQPSLALFAPLGTLGIQAAGLLIAQTLAIAGVAPLLFLVARRHGASGRLAAVPALLWLVSPVVVKANLFEFHPDVFVPILLVGSVVALLGGRTWLFALLLVIAVGFKEDVGLTVAALGIALAWTGRRRLGVIVAAAGATWSALILFLVLPLENEVVHRHYAKLFAGDRGDGLGDVVRYSVRHPLDSVGSVLALDRLGILVMLVATTAGLCLLAPRWLVVAAPTTVVSLLSAYDPQRTLDYHYWLVPAAGVALAGAVGAGSVPAAWRSRWARAASVTAAVLAVLSIGALSTALREVRSDWSGRADREAAVREVPAGASVSVPRHYFAQLSGRRELYALPEPIGAAAVATEWGSPERRRATDGLEFVIVDSTSPERVPEATLERLGFKPVLQRGDVVVYGRAR